MFSQAEVEDVVGPDYLINQEAVVGPDYLVNQEVIVRPDYLVNQEAAEDPEVKNVKDPVHTPKNYTLHNARDPQNHKVHFYAFGCGGVGNEPQKKVAQLMHQIALEKKQKPKFIVILGDNFYTNGVTSEYDPSFKTKFENVYLDKELTQTYGIPCFLIPGNHDHNVHYWGTKGGNIDFSRIAAQIQYSRLVDGKKSRERETQFASHELDLKKLGVFNMPTRYYSCTVPAEEKNESDMEMYFVDSTTYVKDYLTSLTTEKNNPNNQANWLETTAKKNPDAVKLFFSHHPRYAVDKRFFHSDAHYHLSQEDIATLRKLGIEGNYNQMLDAILHRQGLNFDANFSAHTHSLYYHYSNEGGKKLCQIGAGGGGGALEDRQNFTNRHNLPCYIKQHGFVEVDVDLQDKSVTCDLHSLERHHLKFKNNSATPIKLPAAEAPELVLLRTAVFEACEQYFDFLQNPLPSNASTLSWAKHYVSHGSSGAYRADDLINFFNRHEPVTYDESVMYIINRMKRWSQVKDNSLESYLSDALQKHMGLTYTEFVARHLGTNNAAEPVGDLASNAGQAVVAGLGAAASWLGTNIMSAVPQLRRPY